MVTAVVFGALSCAGRHIVRQLSRDPQVTHIRAVDCSLKQLAFLSDAFKEAFEKAEYLQANYFKPGEAERAYLTKDNVSFDWVFNCSIEVKAEQVEIIYKERVYGVSMILANLAVKHKAKAFIHMSSAREYVFNGQRATEGDKRETLGNSLKSQYVIKTCDDIKNIKEYGIIYGPGDFGWMTHYTCSIYIANDLNVFFPKTIPVNLMRSCVHAEDVARAAVLCADWKSKSGNKEVSVFNLATPIETDIKRYVDVYAEIYPNFKVKDESCLEPMGPNELAEARDYLNEVFLEHWLSLVHKHNTKSSPLTPYLDEECVSNFMWSVDGSKIERELGFTYKYQQIEADQLRETVEDFKSMGIWPE